MVNKVEYIKQALHELHPSLSGSAFSVNPTV